MAGESFSFRWGIPLLDEGDTRIPNFFFDHYTEAGVTRMEFLTILHLARYQFEKAGSECRPSVGTVARQMGYTVRGLQKVLAGMERRGFLARHYRSGRTTIYDFTGFSRAILAIKLSARGEPQFTPTPEPQFTPVVNPSSPKEEQQEQQIRSGDGDSEKPEQHLTSLIDFGVSETVARKLAHEHDPDQVQAWIAYAKNATSLRDPVGLVVARLRDGEPAPTQGGDGDKRRGGIQTAMCPACFHVIAAERACPNCGRCPQCCECEEAEEG